MMRSLLRVGGFVGALGVPAQFSHTHTQAIGAARDLAEYASLYAGSLENIF